MFQPDCVRQYLTIRTDEGILFLPVPFDRGAGRRAGFQKFMNRRPQRGAADGAAVSGVGEAFDRLQRGGHLNRHV